MGQHKKICLSVCLTECFYNFTCLTVCLTVCLFVCLSACVFRLIFYSKVIFLTSSFVYLYVFFYIVHPDLFHCFFFFFLHPFLKYLSALLCIYLDLFASNAFKNTFHLSNKFENLKPIFLHYCHCQTAT